MQVWRGGVGQRLVGGEFFSFYIFQEQGIVRGARERFTVFHSNPSALFPGWFFGCRGRSLV